MDLESYYRFFLALGFVLGLIWLATWAVKRFGIERNLTGQANTKGKRLAIVEVQALDARRKLVLLRRDCVEHLVILGTNQELLVEASIAAPGVAPQVAGPGSDLRAGGDSERPHSFGISSGLEAWRKRRTS